MRRFIARSILASVALLALGGVANAGVLYQNPDPFVTLPPGSTPGTPGNVDAWTINFGFSVSDSFHLGSSSSLTSIDFLVWNLSGDHTTSVDWTISSGAGGTGTVFG